MFFAEQEPIFCLKKGGEYSTQVSSPSRLGPSEVGKAEDGRRDQGGLERFEAGLVVPFAAWPVEPLEALGGPAFPVVGRVGEREVAAGVALACPRLCWRRGRQFARGRGGVVLLVAKAVVLVALPRRRRVAAAILRVVEPVAAAAVVVAVVVVAAVGVVLWRPCLRLHLRPDPWGLRPRLLAAAVVVLLLRCRRVRRTDCRPCPGQRRRSVVGRRPRPRTA